MKDEKIKGQIQVFVCNNKDCAEKGSKELTDKLKKWSKEETDKEVKIFRSGCLGKCSEGIAIAIYPEKKMLVEVEESDYKELRDKFMQDWKAIQASNEEG